MTPELSYSDVDSAFTGPLYSHTSLKLNFIGKIFHLYSDVQPTEVVDLTHFFNNVVYSDLPFLKNRLHFLSKN